LPRVRPPSGDGHGHRVLSALPPARARGRLRPRARGAGCRAGARPRAAEETHAQAVKGQLPLLLPSGEPWSEECLKGRAGFHS
jgi:hypothetical protein